MARDVEIDILANDKTDRGTKSAINNFQDLDRKTSKVAQNIGKSSTKIGVLFGENVAKGVARVTPLLSTALVGIGASAAPLLGASIAGAIIGGAGGLGVIGGVLLAARDPRVKAAGSALGSNMLASLESKADVFVEPVLRGIDTIQKRFDGLSGNFENIFGNSSRYVAPLVDGITRGISSIIVGIDKLSAVAGPSINAISDGVADFGKALGNGFESLADNGDSAADALSTVFGILNSGVSTTMNVVNVLTELYEINRKIGGDAGLRLFLQAMGQDLEAVGENGRKGGSGTFDAANGINAASGAAQSAGLSLSELNDRLQETANTSRNLYSAQTSAAEAIARTTGSIRENGKTLNINTAAGRANRTSLANLATALNAQYQATLKVNGAGRVADGVASRNRESFVRLATQLTGSAAKARALANQLLGIPAKRDTKVYANTHDAAARLSAIQGQLNSIKSKTVTVNVRYKGDGANQNSPSIGGGGGRQFSGNTYASSGNSGLSRTGGPSEVTPSVNNDVRVYVDGAPVRAYVRETQKKNHFVGAVGGRYA
jgi:hypothetical protein